MRFGIAALCERMRAARLRELVAEYEAEFGPIPAQELAEARAAFEAAEAAWHDHIGRDETRPPTGP
jgi:hypothetical protein